jgi:hypothetical protein
MGSFRHRSSVLQCSARRPEFTEMCTIDNDDIALWCMNEFRWEIFTFNKHMLDREPEETVPRLMARSQS